MPDLNFLTYNALDAACTLQAYNTFWPDVLDDGYKPAYDLTTALFEPLMFMQTRGILVDMVALEETKRDILAQAKAKQEDLNTLCGRELNVNSNKDCQRYFYLELGIPPYYNGSAVTVDDLALQRMARGTAKHPGLRQAKLVQDIRGLQKLHGTYLDIEFDGDGRMRCSYNPRGTKFGRLSSSKTIFNTGTNMQNLPQEFKRFLVADPGCVFWEVDKRQAEWVVVAYLAADANMISVIEAEKDTHVHTASLMFGVEPEIVMLDGKLVGMNTDADTIRAIREQDNFLQRYISVLPRTMSARQCGKKSNHGLNYDEGPNQFALINEILQGEAKRIVDMYHQVYPSIRSNYYEFVKKSLNKDRFLTNCFNRKVRFMDAWGPDLWKAAYAMLPQSTVVDSLNQGMVEIYHSKWCDSQGTNLDLLAQVHDSILLQVPIEVVRSDRFQDVIHEVYLAVSPNLCYNGRDFKIATDMKLGLNWAGYSDKNPQGMREVKSPNNLGSLEWLDGNSRTG